MTSVAAPRRPRLPVLAPLLTVLAVALASFVTAPTASATPGPNDRYRTFNASAATVGPVPDGPDTGGTCSTPTPAVKELTIPVSGVVGPITDVRVQIAIEHAKIGDVGLQLVAPNGTTVAFVDRIGANVKGCGDDTGINGTFAFFDGAPANIAALAAQRDDASSIGGGSYTGSSASGGAVPMTAPFANTPANGTWRLRIIDYEAGNVGRVYSANLQLAQADLASSPGCQTAKAASTTAKQASRRARQKLNAAYDRLHKAKRHGSRAAVAKAAKAVSKKRVKEKAALLASENAARAKTSACGS